MGTNVANGSVRIWFFGIINPCAMCWHSRRVFFSEKMTSLEISDMYFVNFDAFGQYLNHTWSMFVQQVSVQVYMSPNRGPFSILLFSWAELWLVTKKMVQIQPLERIVYTSRLGVIFENSKNCRHIISTSCRSIFHAPKSSPMLYKNHINAHLCK